MTTPKGLQRKCLFDVLFYLVRRGRENLREQTKETFAFGVDSQQRRFVYQAIDELDKNHRETDKSSVSTTDGRMYEQPGPLCPVRSFEKYLSKLHPELQALWQRPKPAAAANKTSWYSNARLAKNTLGSFMKDVSKEAGLSKEYTNHSVRATAVTVLDHCNVEARHIMRVSGHKSESSLRSYSRRLSEDKQREIADNLGQACGMPSLPSEEETSTGNSLQLTNSQYDEVLHTISSSPLPLMSLPGSPVLHASQTNSVETGASASGAFNNCNVTFNFNYK